MINRSLFQQSLAHPKTLWRRQNSAEKIARRVQLSGEGTFRHEHICAITYLTDVGPLDPAFAVVPFTHRMPADDPPERGVPAEVRRQLGDDFHEVLLLGAAGTTIICAHPLPPCPAHIYAYAHMQGGSHR